MAKTQGNGKMSQEAKVAVGAGLAALAIAGAAGAYFLYGKDGAKNRKQVKSWALKAKAEVLEKLEKARVLSEENYHMIVDAAMAKYAKAKNVAPAEVADLSRELKSHWKRIKTHLNTSGSKSSSRSKSRSSRAKTTTQK
jgi:hypothetical protein